MAKTSLRSKRFRAFRSKEREGESKWRKQKSGEGMEKKGSFLPSPPPPPPPLSFFGARFISRAAKAVNPVCAVFFLILNQTETLATQAKPRRF